MQTRRVDISKDMPLITSWLKEYKTHIPELDDMPAIGYLVCIGDVPAAVGFLRLVEGGYGYVDSVTANPKANAAFRDKALDQVFASIIEKAKELKLKGISGTSVHNRTLIRAERHGFIPQPHLTMVLSLQQQSE